MNHMHAHPLVISALVAVVFPVGAVLADTRHVPAQYPTIQAAIDAAVNGDTVMIADGTYTGVGNRDLDFSGRAITVRSANGAANCVIDIQGSAGDPHRAFNFHGAETAASVVEGFTIQNGFMNRGGAVLCEGGSSPLFQSCIFKQNSVSQAATEDGGGAVYTLDSSPTFIDSEFMLNHVEANFLFGGGGAVQIQSASNPAFIGCAFSENTAFGSELSDGGAVFVWEDGHPEFFACTFIDNQASWDGAVSVSPSASGGVAMHDCLFQGNTATNGGGGAYGQYGVPFVGGSSSFVSCFFIGNSAIGNSGGAVVVEFPNTKATFTNCLFADNFTTDRGGGLWVGRGAEATVTNCTLSGNTAVVDGGALRVFELPIVVVDNCVLWDNAPDEVAVFNAFPSISHSNIQGGWPGLGNINADPLFGEFRLAAGSPCIDTGDPALVPPPCADLDGRLRVWDGDGNGSRIVDMGAYEFGAPPMGDLNCDGAVNALDIPALILALLDPAGYAAAYPNCDGDLADLNCDSVVDVLDVDPFVALLVGF